MTNFFSDESGQDPSVRREQLLRYLEGSLSSHEQEQLSAQLEESGELQEELRALSALYQTVGSSTERTFAPGFSRRVMQRVPSPSGARDSTGNFYEALHWAFLRVAVIAVLLTTGIGAYNAGTYLQMDASQSLVEAIMGLPEVSMESALTYDFHDDTGE